MSFHSIPCWQVRCDWPGCEATPADVSDYSGWGDQSVAHEEAVELDWRTSPDDEQHYCDDHPAMWASDHENGETYPAPPFLLIHDGDTDDPINNDGKVVLVEHTHDGQPCIPAQGHCPTAEAVAEAEHYDTLIEVPE